VVVPTRSDFEEGTPKVAFEAVLNLKPVIMSAACPAIADVSAATVEPRVDDVDDYVRAIESLADDPALYAEKSEAAAVCRLKHFDERRSYGAVLRTGLQPLLTATSRT
jgi:glycosyltransferase involved in cell wall biosynthesis